jgi:hypothetical protein
MFLGTDRLPTEVCTICADLTVLGKDGCNHWDKEFSFSAKETFEQLNTFKKRK